MATLRVGAVQLTCTADLERNLAKCEELVRRAAEQGAELVGLPENFAFIGPESDKFAIAESMMEIGPIVQRMAQLARDTGVWLMLGGMPERTDDPKLVYNTLLLLNAEGTIAGSYRKIHLFDINIPEGAVFTESETVRPGTDPVVADSPWGRLGLSVCYDLRFPELYRRLSAEGARVLFVPAAFTAHTGKAHWHTLLAARAIENLSFVVAPAQFGRHNPKRVSYGHALIIDPWGVVLADAPDEETVVVATLDFAHLDKVRAQLPALEHRRLAD